MQWYVNINNVATYAFTSFQVNGIGDGEEITLLEHGHVEAKTQLADIRAKNNENGNGSTAEIKEHQNQPNDYSTEHDINHKGVGNSLDKEDEGDKDCNSRNLDSSNDKKLDEVSGNKLRDQDDFHDNSQLIKDVKKCKSNFFIFAYLQ